MEKDKTKNGKKKNVRPGSFSELSPTTMTLVSDLVGEVNILNATPLLEVYQIDSSLCSKSKTKVKIPHIDVPGVVLSLMYGNYKRGIVKSKKYFRNSIMMVISTERKNVNMKLSKSTIQMCGAKDFEMGQEATKAIIDNLKYCQSVIDKMKKYEGNSIVCAKWVKKKTKGKIVEDGEDKWIGTKIPKEFYDGFPEYIDKDIASFMIRKVVDYPRYSDYVQQIDWLMTFPKICSMNISSSPVMTSMVNYNYYIGHSVDRWKLSRKINDLNIPGIKTRFVNIIDTSARVLIEYQIFEHLVDKIRKRSGRNHYTFLIHMSGQVTLSGPHPEMNKFAYITFMDVINKISDEIRTDY